jgi:rhodanese-related sulfurtransferase
MKNLSQSEWAEGVAQNPEAIILDVRTADECAGGIIENAKCLDLFKTDEFKSQLEKMDKSKSYYVYCRSGQRSANACMLMDEMGFTKTNNLLGGIMAWKGKTV